MMVPPEPLPLTVMVYVSGYEASVIVTVPVYMPVTAAIFIRISTSYEFSPF